MPWFWGSSKNDDDDEYSSGEEEYTSSEDDDVSYITSDDDNIELDEDTSTNADEEEEDDDDDDDDEGNADENESSQKEETENEQDESPANDQPDGDRDEDVTKPISSNDEDIVSQLLHSGHEDDEESEKSTTEHVSEQSSHSQSEETEEESEDDRDGKDIEDDETEDRMQTDSADEEPQVNIPVMENHNKEENAVEVERGDESGSVDEEDMSTEHHDDDSTSEDNDEEDDEVTTIYEKQSLLILAAEHDRVDIIKAILDADSNSNNNKEDAEEEKLTLMNGGIPPLHIAITYGSVNAATSLLRMGADPSVRPCVEDVKKQQAEQPEGTKADIPNMERFDDLSAWELLFGFGDTDSSTQSGSRWSLFGSSSSQLEDDMEEPSSPQRSIRQSKRRKGFKPVDLAPSKREGIRHAFTAEALRCIGGDEVERLRQLVDSGMPPTIELGGKDLMGWSVDMDAMQCQTMLRDVMGISGDEESGKKEGQHLGNPSAEVSIDGKEGVEAATQNRSSAVLDRGGGAFGDGSEMSLSQLRNRLDELGSLGQALSTCLDNLAEEVSVCHGLLLNNMGGSGASALASHVRSLKELRQQREDQLYESQHELEDAQFEMQQLVQRIGPKLVAEFSSPLQDKIANNKAMIPDSVAKVAISPGDSGPSMGEATGARNVVSEEQTRRDLMTQIVASESKVSLIVPRAYVPFGASPEFPGCASDFCTCFYFRSRRFANYVLQLRICQKLKHEICQKLNNEDYRVALNWCGICGTN